MPFLYLRDPLFLVSVFAYVINRLVLKNLWSGGFCHEHFNDLLCVPFWVPIMLTIQHRLGLRHAAGPPQTGEIIIPLILWSWVFEILLPRTGILGEHCVADYLDVLWYAIGALLAAVTWRWFYYRGSATTS